PRLVRLRRIPSGSPGGSFDGKPWPRSATLSNDTWRTPPFADGRPRQWDNEEALGPSTRFTRYCRHEGLAREPSQELPEAGREPRHSAWAYVTIRYLYVTNGGLLNQADNQKSKLPLETKP